VISRREFARNLARGTTALAAGASISVRAAPGSAQPLAGPWTGFGSIRRAGGDLHFVTLGDRNSPPPVVLLHKLGGWSADWRDVAPALIGGRQVIAFDLPGHGASRWRGEPPQVQTVFETATLLLGALQEMDVPRLDLIGTSLGGCAAAAMAALAPDRVRRLALPSCALGPASTREQVARKEEGQASMFTAGGDPLPIDAYISRDILGLIDADRIGAEQNASRRQAGRWIRPHERGVAYTDFIAVMRRITAPTRLMYGARDRFFLKYRAGAETALHAGRTVILPDASGFHVQDNPRETALALAQFLAI
jgi:pimeloyl-ACP methyl ester carboxylesterase